MIELGVPYLLGGNLFGLREMHFGRVRTQDQDGALVLPSRVTLSLLEVAAVHHRVVGPLPRLAIIHLEPDKVALAFGPFQGAGALVEGGAIAGSRQARFALLLAALFPVRKTGQIRAHRANGSFDHTAAIDGGHAGKALREVPTLPGLR